MAIDAAQLRVVVSADTSKAQSELKSFSGSMKSMTGSMGAVGGVMAAAISAPLIGIGVSAIKTAATFEKSMNVLGYVTEGTAAQMQAMSDQALQLGADTVFSANEAAEGMVELAKAGMDTEDVMGAIPGVMDLAAAGQISVAEAATLASATLNTFGLEAEKSGEVADILAAAANASSADIRDLAFGVQNAGSVFASSGQSVETLATMMALLANNGLNASDAATSLKTMTMRLTAPTDKAAAVMRRLGIAVFDADGNMRDYQDIIGDLESATKSLSDEQRSAALNTIFGADAIRAAIIMADEGVAGYEAMETAVMEQGAAAAMAGAQNSGLAGAMEQISGSIDTVMTKLALPFLETLATWGQKLAEFVNKMGELPQPVINAALAFAGFAGALGLVMGAIGGAMLLLAPLSGTVGLVALALVGLGAAAAVAWAAWELNIGNIQATMQPFAEAFDTAKFAAQDLFNYLATAVSEGDVFNAWLLSIPEDMVPFAESIAEALITVKEFGTETKTTLENLSSYFLAVGLGAAALNIWLFTLPTQMQSFALSVGEAIVSVKAKITELQTALSEIKLPDLSNFGMSTTKTNIEMGLVVAFKAVQIDWSSLTSAVEGVDFSVLSTRLANKITELANTINSTPIPKIEIDWVDILTAFLPKPIGLAVKGIQWAIDSESFAGLKTSVEGAIGEIEWGTLGAAFTTLKIAVEEALTKLFPEAPPEPPKPPITTAELETQIDTGVDWGVISASIIANLNAQTAIVQEDLRVHKPGALGEAHGAQVRQGILDIQALRQDMQQSGFELGRSIEEAVNAALTGITWSGIAGALGTLEASIYQTIGEYIFGFGKELTERPAAYTQGLRMGAPEPGAGIDDALASFTAKIATFEAGVSAAIGGLGVTWLPGVGTAFQAMDGAIQGAITDLGTRISGWFTDTINRIFAGTATPTAGAEPGAFGGAGGGAMQPFPHEADLGDPLGFMDKFFYKSGLPDVAETAMESPDWATIIKPPDWALIILPLDWAAYVLTLAWETFVRALDWEGFVSALDWHAFVSNLVWESYVTRLSWQSFITNVDWGQYVPDLSWSDFISTVDWGRYIPALNRPPDGGAAPAAGGTVSAAGDFSMAAAGGVTINVYANVASDIDVEALAVKVANKFRQKMR